MFVLKFIPLMLLFFVLCSNKLRAQVSGPVVSTEYRRLAQVQQPDSLLRTNNLQRPVLYSSWNNDRRAIKKIYTSNDQLVVKPVVPQMLKLGIKYNGTVELRSVNRQPSLQRSWAQGPDAGGMFSYGPLLSALEYNDNGDLVPVGSGNGQKAAVHDNGIFRNGSYVHHVLSLNADYLRAGQKTVYSEIKLAKTDENTYIRQQHNNNRSLGITLGGEVARIKIKGKYNDQEDRFSNANRNGFLNRVYRNALLTPAGFDNARDITRSYSNEAENPLFLLEDDTHFYRRRERNGSLTAEHYGRAFDFFMSHSLQQVNEDNNEGYPAGVDVQRRQCDIGYVLNVNGGYRLTGDDARFNFNPALNYLFHYTKTDVDYNTAGNYTWQRPVHEVLLKARSSFGNYPEIVALELGNRFYSSGTAARSRNWLPYFKLTGSYEDLDWLDMYAGLSYSTFSNELPVNKSLARTGLLRLAPDELQQYMPLQEVKTYKGLELIGHREWSGNLSFRNNDMRMGLDLSAYRRQTDNDVLPLIGDEGLLLKNVADHLQKGMEVQLAYYSRHYGSDRVQWHGRLSFAKDNSKVTHVRDGYNYTPIVGFRTVYNALVEGEPVGAIVGSAYRRNEHNQVVIGSEGFPLVQDAPKVIGNPLPDFSLKTSHTLSLRRFTLNVDVEWRQGGDVWNGTQAALDYYGRSAYSGGARGTTGYVFGGVQESGHMNETPVTFYDPSKPLSQNRWVRYGIAGVAESYVQDGSLLRISNIILGYAFRPRRWVQELKLSAYAGNLLLWTAYKGGDPQQLLMDIPGSEGLDFFNLPSRKTFGFNVSISL